MIRSSARAVSLCLAALLAACGGGGGGSDKPTPSTGHFIDSAVAGIGYRTATQHGVTGPNGEYRYLPGEQVTFFIGALQFPPAPAAPVVTPLTLAGTTQLDDQRVVNMTRLLMSLDEDGDPSNGIFIPAGASSVAVALDFDVPTTVFEASSAVTTFVGAATGTDGTLVTSTAAASHLQQSVIQGTWVKNDTNDPGVLVLLANGWWFFSEPSGPPTNGVDLGRYTYDPIAKKLSTTITFESNTSGGWGDGVGSTATVAAELDPSGDLSVTGPHGGFTLSREPQGTGLEGTWLASDSKQWAAFVFYGNSQFVYVENKTDSKGMDAGTYGYEPQTHWMTFAIGYTDMPDRGIYKPDPECALVYDANGLDLDADPAVLTSTAPTFRRQ
jgi:hypothetical protein